MEAETQPDTIDELTEIMTDHFEEFEAEYRSEEWCEIVYEDGDVIVLADHKGYELTEWGNELDDYHKVCSHMHDRAKELCDYNWVASYPVVFEKR